MLAKHLIKLQNELETLKNKYGGKVDDKNTMDCAMHIRDDIFQLEDTISWPPQPEDRTPEKVNVPASLNLLLKTIFDVRKPSESPRSSRIRLSISQDIIYAATKGRVRTPKSVLLPSLVKTLTNNTEVINILNRLGHGISDTVLMETQTENAYQILEQQMTSQCIIPKHSKKEAFTIFVADNIDRNEETLSG